MDVETNLTLTMIFYMADAGCIGKLAELLHFPANSIMFYMATTRLVCLDACMLPKIEVQIIVGNLECKLAYFAPINSACDRSFEKSCVKHGKFQWPKSGRIFGVSDCH